MDFYDVYHAHDHNHDHHHFHHPVQPPPAPPPANRGLGDYRNYQDHHDSRAVWIIVPIAAAVLALLLLHVGFPWMQLQASTPQWSSSASEAYACVDSYVCAADGSTVNITAPHSTWHRRHHARPVKPPCPCDD
jgi:hypothetical protein